MNLATDIAGSVGFSCNEQAVVQAILFSSISFDAGSVLDKPLITMAKPDNLDPMLHFLEALKQFGNAEGWHLQVQLGKELLYLTFSGLIFDRGFIIVGNSYPETATYSEGKHLKANQESINAQVSLEKNKPFTTEMDEHELLDELSRLNNELINSKRELVRQKIAMERLKNQENA